MILHSDSVCSCVSIGSFWSQVRTSTANAEVQTYAHMQRETCWSERCLSVSMIASMSESPSAMAGAWTAAKEPFAARSDMLCWLCRRQRQRSSPVPAVAARPSPSCPHSSHRAGKQTPCSPCRFSAKWLFFLVQELPGGTRGLMGCVKGAPVCSAQSHLSGQGGGKGENYCTNSHSRLIAFHLWAGVGLSALGYNKGLFWLYLFRGRVQPGVFGRGRLKFLGEMNRGSKRSHPPGAGNCYDANGSDYRMFTTTNGVFVSYHFSSPWILCCESFSPQLLLVMVCCCLLCPDLADKSHIFDRAIHVSEVLVLPCQLWCLSYESCNIQCFL